MYIVCLWRGCICIYFVLKFTDRVHRPSSSVIGERRKEKKKKSWHNLRVHVNVNRKSDEQVN